MGKPIGKFDFLRVTHLWIIKLIDWNAARSKAGRERWRVSVATAQDITAGSNRPSYQTTGPVSLDLLSV